MATINIQLRGAPNRTEFDNALALPLRMANTIRPSADSHPSRPAVGNIRSDESGAPTCNDLRLSLIGSMLQWRQRESVWVRMCLPPYLVETILVTPVHRRICCVQDNKTATFCYRCLHTVLFHMEPVGWFFFCFFFSLLKTLTWLTV